MKHGKKYTEAAKLVDRATSYEPAEAIALVKKTATANSKAAVLKANLPLKGGRATLKNAAGLKQ